MVEVHPGASPPPDGAPDDPLSELDLVFAFHRLTWGASRPAGVVHAQARVAELLVEDRPFHGVLIADHPTSVVSAALRRPARERPRAPGVRFTTPHRLRRRDPAARAALWRTYRRLDTALERTARREGLDRPVVLTTNPFLAAHAELRWARRVVHFATDDFSVGNRWSGLYGEAYGTLSRSGIPVAAVTAEVLRRIAPQGPSLVVPNGVEPGEWLDAIAPPAWFAALPRPRLLYVGGLMGRLDTRLLLALARARPDASVVLLGRVIDEGHVASLRGLPNVVFHDAVDREELRGVVAAADVGLVPHVVNAMTRGMSPLKAYEYVAAGLPVVATELPELTRLGERVLVRGADAFLDGVGEALALGRAAEGERRGFVLAHSWRTQVGELLRFAADA